MTTTQIVEMSVNNKSPIQDYIHPDSHTQPTYMYFLFSEVNLWSEP